MQAGAATMGIELKARLHATLACAWRVARFGFITTSITEVFITIVAATATALVPWFIFFHWKFAELTGTEVQQLQTLSVLSLALDFITSRVYTLAALLGDLPSIGEFRPAVSANVWSGAGQDADYACLFFRVAQWPAETASLNC